MSTTFLSDETTRYYEDMWIAYQLKALSKDRYWFLNGQQFGICKKEWWSITSNKDWKKMNFHFEIIWKDKLPMTKASEFGLIAHIESQFIGEEINNNIRSFFKEHHCRIDQNTIKEVNGAKLDASVIPDFSNEEKAKETVLKIIAALDSPAYQQCAYIADAYLNQMKKGK